MTKEKILNELIEFFAENEESPVDFSKILVNELTTISGNIFLQTTLNGKSAIFCMNGPFLSLIMNNKKFNEGKSTYSYIQENSEKAHITNLFQRVVCKKILTEGESVSLGKIIGAFGLGECKINAYGNKTFIVKTKDGITQFCSYIKNKLFTIEVPSNFILNKIAK